MVTANSYTAPGKLLSEAAAEIAALDSPGNYVCRRLLALQERWSARRITVGQLANRLDISPRDVLDLVLEIGVDQFWHQGKPIFTAAELVSYLSRQFFIDPVPELECILTTDQQQQLAEITGVVDERRTSESAPPAAHAAADSLRSPSGTGARTASFVERLARGTGVSESEIEKLLIDATAEIALLDGTENPTFRKLLGELQSASSTNESSPQIARAPRKFAPSESQSPPRVARDKKQSG